MFLIIDIYRLGVVYPYLSTSISLDECDYYRYISHIIINVINNDEEIYIAIYLPKKFPDETNTVNLPYMHPLYMHSLYIYTSQLGPNLGLSAKCTFYIYIFCKCTLYKKNLY